MRKYGVDSAPEGARIVCHVATRDRGYQVDEVLELADIEPESGAEAEGPNAVRMGERALGEHEHTLSAVQSLGDLRGVVGALLCVLALDAPGSPICSPTSDSRHEGTTTSRTD